MPQYLLTGETGSGQTIAKLVKAASASAAMRLLGKRGLTNITLYTDDSTARTATPLVLNDYFTANDLVRNRTRGPWHRLLASLVGRYTRHGTWLAEVIVVLVLVVRYRSGAAWGVVEWLLVAALLLSAALAIDAAAAHLRYYRLVQAHAWGRWNKVLRLLKRHRKSLEPHLVALHEAKALSGLGRVDEALQVIEPFANGSEIPREQYWSLLMCAVHSAAGQEELELAAHEKAAELAPDSPLALIGLAVMLLGMTTEVGRAKQLLERARRQPLSDLASNFAAMAEGMVALEEGNAALAVEQLEAALRRHREFARANPQSAATADLIEARLAVAKALAGDFTAARKHFRRAEPRLRALKKQRLLERCQRALG